MTKGYWLLGAIANAALAWVNLVYGNLGLAVLSLLGMSCAVTMAAMKAIDETRTQHKEPYDELD